MTGAVGRRPSMHCSGYGTWLWILRVRRSWHVNIYTLPILWYIIGPVTCYSLYNSFLNKLFVFPILYHVIIYIADPVTRCTDDPVTVCLYFCSRDTLFVLLVPWPVFVLSIPWQVMFCWSRYTLLVLVIVWHVSTFDYVTHCLYWWFCDTFVLSILWHVTCTAVFVTCLYWRFRGILFVLLF